MPRRTASRPPVATARRYRVPGLSQLQVLRIAKNRTQRELADAVGCCETAIHQWETHAREPSPEHRRNYAQALGITVPELGALIYEATNARHAVGKLMGAHR